MTTLVDRPSATPAPAVATPPPVTVVTARVVGVGGLLARVAVQLNPYDVRELQVDLDAHTLRVVIAGTGFDADRVIARLGKVIGVLDVSIDRRPS